MPDGIHPVYFDQRKPWSARASEIIETSSDRFVSANLSKLKQILSDDRVGARVVVNIGAWSLCQFLQTQSYLNAYQLAMIGVTSRVDTTRQDVDALLEFSGGASNVYFGAVALESAGVRFYGEYCMVLKPTPGPLRIFDRDSYELVFPPLGDFTAAEKRELSRALRGNWATDLESIASLKCQEVIDGAQRVVTEGRVRDALLRGEEFIEVHRQGSFHPGDLEEVRIAPVDVAMENQIVSSYIGGLLPRAEELVWLHNRARAEAALGQVPLAVRVSDAAITR